MLSCPHYLLVQDMAATPQKYGDNIVAYIAWQIMMPPTPYCMNYPPHRAAGLLVVDQEERVL
jgi:hypothetical protein